VDLLLPKGMAIFLNEWYYFPRNFFLIQETTSFLGKWELAVSLGGEKKIKRKKKNKQTN
jgi:hypothetical protein